MSTNIERETRIQKLIPNLYLGTNEYEKGVSMFTEWSNHDGKSMYTENKLDNEIINAFYEYYNSYNTVVPHRGNSGGKKSRKMRKSRKSKRSRKSRRHRH